MPVSTTVPATPAAIGAGGGTSTGAGGAPGGPDNKLLSFIAFNFVRHARIGDLHQALNNNYSDTICDAGDIDTIFTANRADVKSDTDLMRAIRRLLVERVIAPVASETSGDKANTVMPTIERASFKVSDLKGKHNIRLNKNNLTRILNEITAGGSEATIVIHVGASHMYTDLRQGPLN